jgi:uncharacterized membrane protein
LIQTVVDILKQWQPHPFIDHFTVALIIVAVVVDLIASLLSSRLWVHYMAVTLMVLAAIAAAGSYLTGGWEAERLWDHVTGPGKSVLERHALLGSWLPWALGVLALWRLGIQSIGFIGGSRPLYLLVAVLAVAMIVYQGYLGGQLVYTYGVGTGPEAAGALPVTASPAASPSAAATEAAPIPTVYVPPAAATPGAMATPAASEQSPSAANTPAEPSAVVSGALPSPPFPATTPYPTPLANPPASGSGTPVNPPKGSAAPLAPATPVPQPEAH